MNVSTEFSSSTGCLLKWDFVCGHGKVSFFSLPFLWNCSCFLANLLRWLFSLQCWQGQGKDVARGNHTSSIKSWLESQAAHSLWFLKVCQKSCIIWKRRQDFWTKINSWIFWTAHVQSSNENVLEGSVNSGLWDQLHHWSDNTTEHLKFSKNPRLEKFGSKAEDVNASRGLRNSYPPLKNIWCICFLNHAKF